MRFSDDQKAIIGEKINNILVSAAAGSGKTTVLVERILTKIIAGEYNIDELLVVTFTNEAADNMRKKINNSINSKIKEFKADAINHKEDIKKLQRQLDKLPNAYIQTINSFCARVIKEKGYIYTDPDTNELIEPGIPIIDDNTRNIILKDAIEVALNDTYSDYGKGNMETDMMECFKLLFESNGSGRDDRELKESLEDTYNKLRSIPDYINEINKIFGERIVDDQNGKLSKIEYLYDDICLCARRALENIGKVRSATCDIDFYKDIGRSDENKEELYAFVESYIDYFKEVISVLSNKEKTDFEKFAILNKRIEADSVDYPPIPNGRNKLDHADLEAIYSSLEPIWNFLYFHRTLVGSVEIKGGSYNAVVLNSLIPDAYVNIFRRDVNELFDQQIFRNKQLCAYIYLLMKIDKAFSIGKKQIHGMDFADQEHIAYAILNDEVNSDAKDYYLNRFAEIYIDEYQDNSKLQDSIISSFAKGEDVVNGTFGNVFRVGDVKQSIYKFRYASPNMFINHMDEFSRHEGGILCLLNSNYRSDKTILDFVNMLFEQLMSKEAGMEIDYDDTQALKYGEKEEENKRTEVVPNVVLCSESMIDKKEALDKDYISRKKYIQRQVVLNEVIKFINDGYKLQDICVLTRSNSTALVISNYLNKAGYPSKVAEKREIFDDNDIKAITNLIITIGNQYRDEYMLGVLLSDFRFSNFTINEIAKITSYAKAKGLIKSAYLIDKVLLYANAEEDVDEELQARTRKFIDSFNKLRLQNVVTDIGVLIDDIFADTGIRATLNQRGKAEVEKLSVFKDFLCNNYLSFGSNIAGVASDLEKMQLKLSSGVAVKVDDTSDNKIRCMTCHSSKGLEFDCVILAEMTTAGNKDSIGGNISFDGELGFIIKDYFYNEYVKFDSIENVYFDAQRKLLNIAEELRLLYVALTRAKKNLSIVVDYSSKELGNILNSMARLDSKNISRENYLGKVKNMSTAMLASIVRTKLVNNCFDEKIALDESFTNYLKIWNTDLFTCDMYEMDYVYSKHQDLKICYPEADELVIDNDVVEEGNSENDEASDGSGNDDRIFFAEDLKTSDKSIVLNNSGYDEDGVPLFEAYSYERATEIPFKVSVSQLKNEFEVKNNVSMNLELPDLSDFIETEKNASSASEIGTFVHSIMRYINLSLIREDASKYDDEIRRLVDKGLITNVQLPLTEEFKAAIVSFSLTDICDGMIKAMERNELYKEKPIVFSVDTDNDDFALVQGVIDMFYIDEDGKAVLVDYKTDNLKKFSTDELKREEAIRRHKVQIDYYCAALESSGIKVKNRYLCLLRHDLMIEI